MKMTNILREESVSEHFPGKENIFTCVSENDRMYVIETEQDSDIESELCVESDETGSDVGSFVVSDSEFEGRLDLPPDAAAVDRAWNEWTPSSSRVLRGLKRLWIELKSGRDCRWITSISNLSASIIK